jgi:3-oxoadipate enol-lactonase
VSVAELNGATISYDVSGSGPAVVLVAQAGCDRRAWRAQIPALERDFTVVAYDQRGHGESSWASGQFSYPDDLRALLDHLEIDRVALVGGSLGGRVCLEFTVLHPERVTHLVPLAIGLPDWDFSQRVRDYWAAEEEAERAGDFERAIELGLELWVDGPRRSSDAVPAEVRELVREMNRSAYAVAVPDPPPGPPLELDPPASARLGEIRAPTLVIVGDEDVEDMQRVADLLAREIAGARKVVLPDTAHMVQLERPDELTRLVTEFLQTETG